ncbi:MAG: conserved phage C-terminal domain-containing protein [Acidobacteria bacterium]|nr:conserved phage C-terminal domain-containing protein [Acidobacteriota bacterium]
MEAAIERFSSPDPHSRTPDNDGRRIEAIDGGWVVLNYARYRARRDPEERRRQVREAVQRHRDKKRNQPVIKNDYDGLPNPDVSHGKPKSEVRSQKSKKETTLSSRSLRSAARRLLAFLNDKAERHYQDVDAHMNMIMARLKDLAARNGHSLDDAEADCRSVIAFKVREWGSDEEMSKYLRPATLFNATKFASYHGELYKPPGGRRS